MKTKRFWRFLLALALAVSCGILPVSATGDNAEDNLITPRAAGRINYSFPANSVQLLGDTFYLDIGDVISYNCSYSPTFASVDFGYIAPNGRFYYLNCTTGSISKGIQVDQRGEYQLAIRNNESYAVVVNGTVNY